MLPSNGHAFECMHGAITFAPWPSLLPDSPSPTLPASPRITLLANDTVSNPAAVPSSTRTKMPPSFVLFHSSLILR
ncbi:unnamed protein product [Chondrus crispus]|uniref:Uncharacterized protein n=1 Tax=Chondrus crispus TaxID=2769 RepID=R7QEK8_CHOCR|nr:unnamed protein product [Chondrus crispus]CDF35891.1 unnamed protein product [Chondrus crispus]|eukprot:XP_005715710.1 unnamed protein product [Chondrus crispus]